jgi:hypothetical protein
MTIRCVALCVCVSMLSTVSFTPGTVSQSDVYIVAMLDTDQNPAT